MATTDNNGLVQLTVTDNINPLQTTINSVSSSVSAALTAMKPDLMYKANSLANANTKKNTLAAVGIVGTTTNPLMFYRTDASAFYTWNGTAWTAITSKQLVVQAGSETMYAGNAASNTGLTKEVTFPTAFKARPEVFVTSPNGRITPSVSNISATGCTVAMRNNSSQTESGPISLRWSAIGYTS